MRITYNPILPMIIGVNTRVDHNILKIQNVMSIIYCNPW